jgi:two-component system cell cycle sensor histidine kinase/response regulator CckA
MGGFSVDAYTDAVEALHNFKPDYYDIIISDICMPEMDGIELCKELSRLDPRVKIFFVSAFQIYIENLNALFPNLTYKRFIDKPVSISKLVDMIGRD